MCLFLFCGILLFVIGIPLIGGRSYCRLICPMGYFIRILVRLKRRFN
ncbi:MAG: 4Fe-4S binding protein [Deltaproteobacteria bacterium]|nr:4Fe-4S binding protein [Deltaproteobacteria bacterium]NOQ87100.1 4Fe-4S binding protein [Deltaproteobacteria bacterium]